MVVTMQVQDMNDQAVYRHLEAVGALLNGARAEDNAEGARILLLSLVSLLDEMDQDDFFGPDGWRRAAGVE